MTKPAQNPFTPSHHCKRPTDNPYYQPNQDQLFIVSQDADLTDCTDRMHQILMQAHAVAAALTVATDPTQNNTLSQGTANNVAWAIEGMIQQALTVHRFASLIEDNQRPYMQGGI